MRVKNRPLTLLVLRVAAVMQKEKAEAVTSA